MDLDHVFICVEDPSSAERVLSDFGVQFRRRAVHRGQGTANACAFFDNAYLELLWRYDDEELLSEMIRPLALWERVRWQQTGASPFGVALRPGAETVPVETWPYHASFLPDGAKLLIVTRKHAAHEALIFLVPEPLPIQLRPPIAHRGRHRRVTRIKVSGPQVSPLSPGLGLRCDLDVLTVTRATEHHLELEWDGGGSGEFFDFRPAVPLTLWW